MRQLWRRSVQQNFNIELFPRCYHKPLQQKPPKSCLKLNNKYYFAYIKMKKLAAILLLAIFAFNLFGYKLYSFYAVQMADKSIAAAVDNSQYNEADLTLVTKPVNLPYYNNTNDFTRAYGETEINGVYYTYVKYRIHNNQLELLCLPNTQKTKIYQAKSNYFNATADIEKKTEKGKPAQALAKKNTISEYEEHQCFLVNNAAQIIYTTHKDFTLSNMGLLHKATAEQPPDFLA